VVNQWELVYRSKEAVSESNTIPEQTLRLQREAEQKRFDAREQAEIRLFP